jgi:pantetheine-phosphate adenylyltransferase
MAEHPRVAVYPGSFDPLTNGHVDIIERGTRMFDRIVVAVLTNADKHELFDTKERVAMLQEVFAGRAAVEIDSFAGLLVDYARTRRPCAIVRGLRAVSDFEYELQMAQMNRHLSRDLETIFLMPAAEYSYVSSRLVKEVAALGGSVAGLVPAVVEARLKRRFTVSQVRQV